MTNFFIFQGNVVFQNINIDFKMTIATFPAGLYVTIMKFYDKVDDNVFTLKLSGEMISKDRREF